MLSPQNTRLSCVNRSYCELVPGKILGQKCKQEGKGVYVGNAKTRKCSKLTGISVCLRKKTE